MIQRGGLRGSEDNLYQGRGTGGQRGQQAPRVSVSAGSAEGDRMQLWGQKLLRALGAGGSERLQGAMRTQRQWGHLCTGGLGCPLCPPISSHSPLPMDRAPGRPRSHLCQPRAHKGTAVQVTPPRHSPRSSTGPACPPTQAPGCARGAGNSPPGVCADKPPAHRQSSGNGFPVRPGAAWNRLGWKRPLKSKLKVQAEGHEAATATLLSPTGNACADSRPTNPTAQPFQHPRMGAPEEGVTGEMPPMKISSTP